MKKNIDSTILHKTLLSFFFVLLHEKEKKEKNFFVVCFFSVAMISTQQTYTQIYSEKKTAIQNPTKSVMKHTQQPCRYKHTKKTVFSFSCE